METARYALYTWTMYGSHGDEHNKCDSIRTWLPESPPKSQTILTKNKINYN